MTSVVMTASAARRGRGAWLLLAATLGAGWYALQTTPGTRLPHQDLLWNDLVALARIEWTAEALTSNSLAAIDFRQGLGHPVAEDPKIIPHLLEPAAILATVLPSRPALVLRNAFLALLCLVCLYRLLEAYDGNQLAAHTRAVLAGAYLLTPMLYHEVANDFSIVFLALPPFVLAARNAARRFTRASWSLFLLSAGLLVSLSDLHLLFFLPALFAWLATADTTLPRQRLGLLFGVATLLALAAYARPLAAIAMSHSPPSAGDTGMPLGEYLAHFVAPSVASLVVPIFAGPVSLFANPVVIGTLVCVALPWSGAADSLARPLRRVLLLCAGLLTFGILCHAVPGIRNRLPSAMRYHLTIVPYLLLLTANVRAAELAAFARTRPRFLYAAGATALAIGVIVQLVLLAREPSAWIGRIAETRPVQVSEYVSLGVRGVLPGIAAYLALALALPLAILSRSPKGAMAWLAVAAVAGSQASRFAVPVANWHYRDPAWSARLLTEVPDCLENLVAASPYTQAPRSFVPIARGPVGSPELGRNDKLLPLIELPEMLGGRVFFQWRHRNSTHAARFNRQVTGTGKGNGSWPPSGQRLDQTIAFAQSTASPFLVAADLSFADDRLDFLGSCAVPYAEKLNPGLGGTIGLYVVRTVAGTSSRALYGRVSASFAGPLETGSVAQLPISYHASLRATTSSGQSREVSPGPDGFARVEATEADGAIYVTSVDWTRAAFPITGGLMWVLVFVFRAGPTARRPRTNGQG